MTLQVQGRHIELDFGARVRFDRTVVESIPHVVQVALNHLPKAAWKPVKRDRTYRLGVWIVSSPHIARLNTDFRDKARPTDVLSFSQLEAPTSDFDPEPEIGDVIVCGKVARAQAKEYGGTLSEETHRLIVHGLLHLFGYDHETNAADAKRMFTLQDRILAQC